MQPIERRNLIRGGLLVAGAFATGALPAIARDNPMPEDLRKALEHAPNTPVLGNAKGDITLTEFFDYNCPYCRTSVKDVHALIAQDKTLRVVFHEWPVFGEGSVFSSKASLAALKQGKYWQFHTALMAIDGKADQASATAVAKQVGLDMERLLADMESSEVLSHIDQSMLLADHMGLTGTPTFIAGDEGLFGKQSLSQLRGLVSRGRATLAES
ncbi:DsbA family protein [Paracoccus sp. NGMCC 1.201697]|uniref:DsbA family protein n=1 Tax=Paracoccus broussonetiae subsp. drimophilus TaxID=3373869 RepID=A0ABW7LFN8_9RHOB